MVDLPFDEEGLMGVKQVAEVPGSLLQHGQLKVEGSLRESQVADLHLGEALLFYLLLEGLHELLICFHHVLDVVVDLFSKIPGKRTFISGELVYSQVDVV